MTFNLDPFQVVNCAIIFISLCFLFYITGKSKAYKQMSSYLEGKNAQILKNSLFTRFCDVCRKDITKDNNFIYQNKDFDLTMKVCENCFEKEMIKRKET